MPRIIAKIKPVGNQVSVDLDGQGFKAKECDVLDQFAAACSADPNNVRTELKPEYSLETGFEGQL